MSDTTISQAAIEIGPFEWTEGDRIELTWFVDADWSGTYTAQIRRQHRSSSALVGEFEVTAVWDAGDETTLFTMTMTKVLSGPIKRGKYYTDVQSDDGLTRVWGECLVRPQVTV